jgi:hypothetical protein
VDRLLTWRRASHASPVAVALLVAANLVPLVGVLWLGWDLPTLVAIYWAENGVVGIFAVGRMLTAGAAVTLPGTAGLTGGRRLAPPPPPPPAPGSSAMAVPAGVARAMLVPFFLVHYGIFWFVHGVFVWTAFPMLFGTLGGGAPVVDGPDASVVLLAACALLVSHGASFVLNWILGGEHAASSAGAEMAAPYARVVILHLTILLGAFGAAILGAPLGALVVMVVLKTGVDLAAHLAERERAAGRGVAARA